MKLFENENELNEPISSYKMIWSLKTFLMYVSFEYFVKIRWLWKRNENNWILLKVIP